MFHCTTDRTRIPEHALWTIMHSMYTIKPDSTLTFAVSRTDITGSTETLVQTDSKDEAIKQCIQKVASVTQKNTREIFVEVVGLRFDAECNQYLPAPLIDILVFINNTY